MDDTIMSGEVVRAEFEPEDVTDGRIVVCVAVDRGHRVGHRRVVMIDADYYESTLPNADDAAVALSILSKMAASDDCWMLERVASDQGDGVVGHAAIEAIWFELTEKEVALLERLDPRVEVTSGEVNDERS